MTRYADSAPLQPRRRPWRLIVLGGVVPWLIAITYFYLRPSLWIIDLVLVPAAWILLVVGILLIAWDVFVSRSGMQCRGPVALGGGWWMCGMRD